MIVTITYPNYNWIGIINNDLKKAGAKFIKPTEFVYVDYGNELLHKDACVVDVDINKLDEYLKAHMLEGNKIADF